MHLLQGLKRDELVEEEPREAGEVGAQQAVEHRQEEQDVQVLRQELGEVRQDPSIC